jgi:HlyD family secretion protein
MNPNSPESSAPSAAQPRRSGLRKWLLIGGIAAFVALVIASFLPKPIQVETALVQRKAFEATVRDEGRAEVRNRYVVSSPAVGRMQRITFKAGADVVANKTQLALLETAPADLLDARSATQANARVLAAESMLERSRAEEKAAQAEATVAANDAKRAAELVASGALSAQDADQARTRAESAAQAARAAQFAVDVARHERTIARAAVDPARNSAPQEYMMIMSPVSGRVLRVIRESEQTVAPGTPLLEVGDPKDLEVRIEVLSRDGVAIRPGARMTLHQWGGDQPLEARVRLVEPAAFTKISALGVEEQRVHVVGDLITPYDQRPTLGDGYRVEAEIVVEEVADAIVVPSGSVFRTAEGAAVYIVENGKAKLRQVKLGRINHNEARIESGVQPGEEVIVYPPSRLAPNGRVKSETVR